MKKEKRVIHSGGQFIEAEVLFYGEEDKRLIIQLYNAWKFTSELATKLGGRRLNVPETLSESVLCVVTGYGKLIKVGGKMSTAFDCYDCNRNERIEVKATSAINDLTSFGPKFNFDRFYFMDFYRDGSFDGKFDVYMLKEEDISNTKVNKSETVSDQQAQKRRPRFSIMDKFVRSKNLKPFFTGNIHGGSLKNERLTSSGRKLKSFLKDA